MRFAGTRVLITGSTRGIGAAAARGFLDEGARVAINGTTPKRVAQAIAALNAPERTVAAPGDIGTVAGCEQVVGAAIAGLGGLDVLVNNAGVYHERSLEGADEPAWNEIYDVNVKGAYFCTRAAIAALRQGDGESGGNIVNVASESGLMGQRMASMYCGSKGAVINMSRSLALELAPRVRINCVCPGVVDTDMHRNAIKLYSDPEAALRAKREYYPMQRAARPEEVAGTILYLASAAASYVTGATWQIDGGSTVGK